MKTYSVWIEIEMHDTETDEYTILDCPGAALRKFRSYKKAVELAELIMEEYEK